VRRIAFAVLVVACSGARPPLPLLADVDRARAATAQEGELAPQALAEADAERGRARSVYQAGDDIAASLHAERAIAGYQHTRMVARSARATADAAKADAELAQKTDELHALEAARRTAERDGDELAKRLLIAREMKSPASSGAADAQREVARLQASRSLAMQARLLCGAAKLVSSSAAGLDAATQSLDALDKKLEPAPKTAPIDEAARARTTCLSILTTARRASTATSSADVLLSELSAASLAPTRDERGIVVTLRDVFRGNAIDAPAQPRLEALGRVASAHGDMPIQIVVHDAVVAAGPSDERAKAVAAALVKGGAKADKIASVMAGTRAPVVDPNDARNRQRNARVEVVFITP
jgi:flagellar motor protein MotB